MKAVSLAQLSHRIGARGNDVVATARKDAGQTAADTPHRSEETLAPMEPGAEGSLGGLWLELTGEQMAHNAEALQELMASRDWPTVAKIQQAFIAASLARMSRTISRHLELTGGMLTQLLARKGAETGKTA